jgi:hypothetical protein
MEWINPFFWDHPTPVNVMLVFVGVVLFTIFMVVGGAALLYAMLAALTWVGDWPWHLVNNRS